MAGQVTGAEYQTLRLSCGLSLTAAAAFHGVSETEIEGWEAALEPIPAEAATALRALDGQIEAYVESSIGQYRRMLAEHGAPRRVALLGFRTAHGYQGSVPSEDGLPFHAYEAVLVRAGAVLQGLGATVTVRYADG